MIVKSRYTIVLGIVFAAIAASAIAHSGARGIVKERMDAMGSMGRHMKSVGTMLRSGHRLDMEQVQEAAHALKAHADEIPDLFPEGSTSPVSEAHEDIWGNWDAFVESATEFGDAALVLHDAAASGDRGAVADAFSELGRSCSGCHEAFRVER